MSLGQAKRSRWLDSVTRPGIIVLLYCSISVCVDISLWRWICAVLSYSTLSTLTLCVLSVQSVDQRLQLRIHTNTLGLHYNLVAKHARTRCLIDAISCTTLESCRLVRSIARLMLGCGRRLCGSALLDLVRGMVLAEHTAVSRQLPG
eukprot:SAG11_NODE_229_length_11945_cov_77.865187_3_plen_147_part_00